MKKYIAPEFFYVELRTEERVSQCMVGSCTDSEGNYIYDSAISGS